MKISLTFLLLLLANLGYSQTCSLFFSEYLEGASNNKAIEIYNPLPTAVNLSDYKIYRYNNGSPTPTDSLWMPGVLNSGSVYVAGNPSAIAEILAVSDTLHTISFFNGDDVIELRYMPTNTTVDVIGIIGNDPGTNWTVGTGATSEFTLVRQQPITNGENIWAISVGEWDVYPQNTTTYLGSHTGAPCCSNSYDTVFVSSCDSYTWSQNGTTYVSSGQYNDTLTNVAGCDSIITLDLTITISTSSSLSVSECVSYLWAQNGQTYTISGTYTDTISNAAGCDSIISLVLTILEPTSSLTSITSCDPYTWTNGVTYFTSGIYSDTLVGANGCDSIATLDLMIPFATISFVLETSCGPFLWNEDGNTYTTSGQYTVTYTNMAGCDSTITLDLTVNPIPNASATDNGDATITASGSGNYQWINCSNNTEINGATSATFAPTANGTYAVVVDNGNCSDTSNCVTINTVGLDEFSALQLLISPNPTNGLVSVFFSESVATLAVYDVHGKLITTGTIQSGAQVSLQTSEVGVYFFEIATSEQKLVKRVVKH